MALIRCPGCGNTVSDTTGQCIHCGYRFTGNRGSSYGTEFYSFGNVIGVWQSEKKIRRYLYSPIIYYSFLALACIFFFLAVLDVEKTISAIYQAQKNPLSGLIGIYASYTMVDSFNIKMAFCVLFLFMFLIHQDAAFLLQAKTFSKWCRMNNINLRHVIKNSLGQNFIALSKPELKSESSCGDFITKTVFFLEFKQTKKRVLIYYIIKFAANLLIALLLYSFATDMVSIYIASALPNAISMGSNISYINGFWDFLQIYWRPIFAALLFIGNKTYRNIFMEKMREARYKWIQTNMPQYAGVFMDYILK